MAMAMHYPGCFPLVQGEMSRVYKTQLMRDNSSMKETPLMRNLQAEMDRLGLNDNSLATAAGLNRDAVRDILRGKSVNPRSDRLDAIASVLGRTIPELLGTVPMSEPGQPPLTRLPPETVKDQTQLQLLRWWGELGRRDRRVILRVVEALAADADDP